MNEVYNFALYLDMHHVYRAHLKRNVNLQGSQVFKYEEYSINNVPKVIKIKQEVIITLDVVLVFTEPSLFFNKIPKQTNSFVTTSQKFKNSIAVKIWPCIYNHSKIAICTSSLLWNWQHPRCYISNTNDKVMIQKFPVKQLQQLMPDMCSMRLHCHDEGSTP